MDPITARTEITEVQRPSASKAVDDIGVDLVELPVYSVAVQRAHDFLVDIVNAEGVGIPTIDALDHADDLAEYALGPLEVGPTVVPFSQSDHPWPYPLERPASIESRAADRDVVIDMQAHCQNYSTNGLGEQVRLLSAIINRDAFQVGEVGISVTRVIDSSFVQDLVDTLAPRVEIETAYYLGTDSPFVVSTLRFVRHSREPHIENGNVVQEGTTSHAAEVALLELLTGHRTGEYAKDLELVQAREMDVTDVWVLANSSLLSHQSTSTRYFAHEADTEQIGLDTKRPCLATYVTSAGKRRQVLLPPIEGDVDHG